MDAQRQIDKKKLLSHLIAQLRTYEGEPEAIHLENIKILIDSGTFDERVWE